MKHLSCITVGCSVIFWEIWLILSCEWSVVPLNVAVWLLVHSTVPLSYPLDGFTINVVVSFSVTSFDVSPSIIPLFTVTFTVYLVGSVVPESPDDP